MILLSAHWIIELTGRLHPLMVHFPIGLLVGALILEIVAKIRKKKSDFSGIVYLGAITSLMAAIMGQLLYQSGDYSGTLIDRHQLLGWTTAALSIAVAFCYAKKGHMPQWMPLTALAITVLCLGAAGHMGASITHGDDYLSGVFKDRQSTKFEDSWMKYDTLTVDQLDQLNLAVRGIFAHNCLKCHSTAKRKGGLALDHKEGVFAGGDYGPVFTLGAAGESEIIRRLKLPQDHDEVMPKKGKRLPSRDIQLIALWIDQGAHWTEAGVKVFREAPLALNKPILPDAADHLTHPVDRLVHHYFNQNGYKWPEPIDDYRFVRRVHMDITGLLPEPSAVEKFVKNKALDKRQTLISDLLSDKENYALHWMSFWNDLLRNDYSGPGFITNGRKQITEWLYQSLLDAKPYDQMVRELIDPEEESEGFIKGIQWRGVVNASQRTELQAAQNISQALMGLNLKCASCHNSFVNNLTLDQAYGFANIFSDSPLEIFRCDKPTGRLAKTAFIYPELGEVMADSLVDRLRQLSIILTQPKNGRLYRTIVNRFWDKLFGRGIVAPVDEMDKTPWSQELLDWLASDFIESGHNFQHLLETIMTSRAYQLPAVDYKSSNYLASESFVFRGPAPRRLSAEQFADAFSQTIHPLYYGQDFIPGMPESPAEWIWFQDMETGRESLPKPGERFFRKKFKLADRPLLNATFLITADHAYTIFVNGMNLGMGEDWREVDKIFIPAELLSRDNIIAVVGTNDGSLANPAGLLFALKLTYEGGGEEYIYSGRSWSVTDELPADDWKTLRFNDTDWSQASSQGRMGYWGKLPDFTFDTFNDKSSFSRASLVKLDPFMKTLGRPTRENVTTTREGEATLLQALMLANDDFLHDSIQKGAKEWLESFDGDEDVLVEQLYWKTLGRPPTSREQNFATGLLGKPIELEVVGDLIWSLLMLPEFQFL